ncbi:MAG: endonuclease/exonuclease/phosphatase family protein [Alphaproteobacteria bacterium]|nr:endonuclease/exonuclease/phosphatase family protein [Alphaproteobacteria bacterium]
MLTVATYNVHSCIGSDRRLDPARVAAVIRALDADVVALQEVDARHHDSGFLDQWAYLGERTGYRCVPGISLRTHRNVFGNALLSRHPVASVRLHDLAIFGREPRGAIDADIDVAGRIVRVVATHLGLRNAERRRQSARLLEVLAVRSSPAQTAEILLGDLNEWRATPRSSIAALLRHYPDTPAPPSFPARWPFLRLDRILADRGLRLERCAAMRSRLARLASDHLPVCARFAWA